MIKLTCIKNCLNYFEEGEDYVLITRIGGGFVEVLTKEGYSRDFIMEYNPMAQYYNVLCDYFNLVPVNKRMVFFEKINHICNFND